MSENKITFNSVDEYISKFTPEVQEILHELRKVIKEAAPEANEKISYQMPAFELNGILVYFAACKNHIGFYPTASGINAFKAELAGYKVTKGSIHFPMDKPLPTELIRKVVQYRIDENKNKKGKKADHK